MDVATATATKKKYSEGQILEMMKEYAWNMSYLKSLNEKNELVDDIFPKVTNYGVEATMPKAQGLTSDPIANEALRRERLMQSASVQQRQVHFIQAFTFSVHYDRMGWRDKMIFEFTLDDKTVREIAGLLEMPRQTVNDRQRAIARIIANTQ